MEFVSLSRVKFSDRFDLLKTHLHVPSNVLLGVLIEGTLKAHLYKEHNCVRVFPLVSGRKTAAKTAARAHTSPWKRKREWRPKEVMTKGVILTIKNTVVVLTTWARQDPRVRY